MSTYPRRWTTEQEADAGRALIAARAAGDAAALRRLASEYVRRNMGLVYDIAKRFEGRGMDRDDLAQEGALGLFRAVSTFEPDRGFKFCTYASWWVRHHMQRAVDDRAAPVHVPVYAQERARKLIRQRGRFRAAAGRDPTDVELQALTGYDAGEQAEAERTSRLGAPLSLDEQIGERAEMTRAGLVADGAPDASERLRTEERRVFARALLSELPDRERFVLERRMAEGEETLASIAVDRGVSRERVRQIERDGLERLRARIRYYRLEAP